MLVLAGCGNAPGQEAGRCRSEGDAQAVVAFWDRSASAEANAPSALVFADSLHILVTDALQCPGSSVTGFLVHARTRGKAHRIRSENTLELPPVSGPRNRVSRDSLRFDLELAELSERTQQEFMTLVDSTRLPPALSAWTDLLGTFEVLTAELADAADHVTKRVYYFSDMYESMTGPGRRDFDRRWPRDFSEAETWARIDAEFVRREMNVDPNRFANVEVRVLTEGLANRPGADQVRHYWEILFAEFGFARVRFN